MSISQKCNGTLDESQFYDYHNNISKNANTDSKFLYIEMFLWYNTKNTVSTNKYINVKSIIGKIVPIMEEIFSINLKIEEICYIFRLILL